MKIKTKTVMLAILCLAMSPAISDALTGVTADVAEIRESFVSGLQLKLYLHYCIVGYVIFASAMVVYLQKLRSVRSRQLVAVLALILGMASATKEAFVYGDIYQNSQAIKDIEDSLYAFEHNWQGRDLSSDLNREYTIRKIELRSKVLCLADLRRETCNTTNQLSSVNYFSPMDLIVQPVYADYPSDSNRSLLVTGVASALEHDAALQLAARTAAEIAANKIVSSLELTGITENNVIEAFTSGISQLAKYNVWQRSVAYENGSYQASVTILIRAEQLFEVYEQLAVPQLSNDHAAAWEAITGNLFADRDPSSEIEATKSHSATIEQRSIHRFDNAGLDVFVYVEDIHFPWYRPFEIFVGVSSDPEFHSETNVPIAEFRSRVASVSQNAQVLGPTEGLNLYSLQMTTSGDRFISFYHERTRYTLTVDKIKAKLIGTDRLSVRLTSSEIS